MQIRFSHSFGGERDINLKVYENLVNTVGDRAILGLLMLDFNKYEDLMGLLKPEFFILDEHQKIFRAIQALWISGRIPDAISVAEQTGLSIRYLLEFYDDAVAMIDPYSYVESMQDRFKIKKIADIIEDIEKLLTDRSSEYRSLYSVIQNKILEGLSENEIFSDILTVSDVYDELIEIASSDKSKRLKTGYLALDNVTGGFSNGDLIIIAARPSVGKTALCINFIDRFIEQGKRVIFFSIEMHVLSILTRFIALHSGVPIIEIRKAIEDDPLFLKALREKIESRYKDRLLLCPSSDLSPASIYNIVRKAVIRNKVDAVFIDYLQLISQPNAKSKVDEIGDITKNLKLLAREFNIPVFVASQLNRAPESRADKRPMLSDLRESGVIEQEADVVMMLYREDYYDTSKREDVVPLEVIVAKNRNGPRDTVTLSFEIKTNRIISDIRDQDIQVASESDNDIDLDLDGGIDGSN